MIIEEVVENRGRTQSLSLRLAVKCPIYSLLMTLPFLRKVTSRVVELSLGSSNVCVKTLGKSQIVKI